MSSSSAPSSFDISSSFPSSGSVNQSRTASSQEQSHGHSDSSNEPADPSSSYSSSGRSSKVELCEVRCKVKFGSQDPSVSQTHSSQTTLSQSTQDSFLKMPKGLEVSPGREGGDETSSGCSSSSSGQSSLGTVSGSEDVKKPPLVTGQVPQSAVGERSLEVKAQEDNDETQHSNPTTVNVQTPIFIDLTFQSQTEQNEPSQTAEAEKISSDNPPPGSPDLLLSTSDREKSMEVDDGQTPEMSVELSSSTVFPPVVSRRSISTGTTLNPCADVSEEDMEIDVATQSSFLLQLSPSQGFPTQHGETEVEDHLNRDPETFLLEDKDETVSMKVCRSPNDDHVPTTDLGPEDSRENAKRAQTETEHMSEPEIARQNEREPTRDVCLDEENQKENLVVDNSSNKSPSTDQSDQSISSTSSQSGKKSSGSDSTPPKGGMGGPSGGPSGGDSKDVDSVSNEKCKGDSSSRGDNNVQSEYVDPSVNPSTAGVIRPDISSDNNQLHSTKLFEKHVDKENSTNVPDHPAVSLSAVQTVTSITLSSLQSDSTNVHTSSSGTNLKKPPVPVYESLRLDDSSESLLDLSKDGNQSLTPLPQSSTKTPNALENVQLVGLARTESRSTSGGVALQRNSQGLDELEPHLDTICSASTNKPITMKTVTAALSTSSAGNSEPKPDNSHSERSIDKFSDKDGSQNAVSLDVTSTVTHNSSELQIRSPMSIMSAGNNTDTDGTAISESNTDSVFALQLDQATSESQAQSENTSSSAPHKELPVGGTSETQSSKSNCEQGVSGSNDSHPKLNEIREEIPILCVADSMKNQRDSADSYSLFSESNKDIIQTMSTGNHSVLENVRRRSPRTNPSSPPLTTKSTPPLKSPRKSLSLRARRTPTHSDKGKRKLSLAIDADSNNLGQPGKQRARSESVTNTGFILGMHSQPDSQFSQGESLDSQFPVIEVPRDSQFESSECSDVPFYIVRPRTEASADTDPNTTERSKGDSSTNVEVTSLFSSVKASSFSRKQTRGEIPQRDIVVDDVFGRRKDPYDFDSEIQDSEVHFVRPRAQRNRPALLHDSVDTSTQPVPKDNTRSKQTGIITDKAAAIDSQSVYDIENVQTGRDTQVHQDAPQKSHHKNLPVSNSNQSTSRSNNIANLSLSTGPVLHTTNPSRDTSVGGTESQNVFVDAESEVEREIDISCSQTGRQTSQDDSTAQRSSSQFLQQGQPQRSANIDLITPSNSQTFPGPTTSQSLLISAHPSFASPIPSTPTSLEFISPSTMVSPSGLEELKRQVGKEGASRFELRHVRTVRTVIEQRIVSSEVIENNRVVQGSSRVWPVSFISILVCFITFYITNYCLLLLI